MPTRSLRRLTLVLATLALVGLAVPAWAHPGFRPNQVPGGQPVDLALVIPHGCTTTGEAPPPEDAQVHPTRLVALQVPDGVTDVGAHEKPGWTVHVERDGSQVTTVEWEADEGTELTTDPIEFALTATPPAHGDRVLWAVYQACTQGSYRWIDEPGEGQLPRAILRLGGGEPTTVEDHHDGAGAGEDDHPANASEAAATTAPAEPTSAPEPNVSPTGDPVAAEAAGDDGGSAGTLGLVAGLAAAVVAGAGWMWWRRRGRTNTTS